MGWGGGKGRTRGHSLRESGGILCDRGGHLWLDLARSVEGFAEILTSKVDFEGKVVFISLMLACSAWARLGCININTDFRR